MCAARPPSRPPAAQRDQRSRPASSTAASSAPPAPEPTQLRWHRVPPTTPTPGQRLRLGLALGLLIAWIAGLLGLVFHVLAGTAA